MKYEGKQPVPWAGFLCALGATIIWSGNFIVARGLFDSVQPATLAFLRWGTAFAALLPLAAIPAWRERQVIRRHFFFLLITALLGVTLFNTLIYLAARSTSALNLALISTTSPMFMLLLARMFLGEAVTPARLAGMAAAVCGVALLVTRFDLSRLASLQFAAGDLLMLSAPPGEPRALPPPGRVARGRPGRGHRHDRSCGTAPPGACAAPARGCGPGGQRRPGTRGRRSARRRPRRACGPGAAPAPRSGWGAGPRPR
ncbi:MAG: DMT family transporter [Desulfocurvibacter africanus]